jgi:hypothetical protein
MLRAPRDQSSDRGYQRLGLSLRPAHPRPARRNCFRQSGRERRNLLSPFASLVASHPEDQSGSLVR